MNIKILGTGCKNCQTLEQNVRKALTQSGKEAEIEKVTDIQEIMSYGVLSTPGIVIDGEVRSTGRVLSPAAIVKLF
ncbi:thioredoxin family protein [Bacillus sp. CLL-7-23]|uniref:Thioredoxin family protein n=1 Tax=Bacillus changyiensis TaxID=3004103 RepID=A0ABT4WZI2_9BACI|nr:thioredoxin family protein [Bacillus changyiensis]MDA7025358.1 thioredoxin family protein [Bacillus changyiensis]